MKNSKKSLRELHGAEQESCNEKKCATCFANRGCIYDRYFIDAPLFNAEVIHAAKEIKVVQAIGNTQITV